MASLPETHTYLKTEEASQYLRRSERTLARIRAEGRGPTYHREGGLVLYPIKYLDEWLERYLVVPPRNSV